MFVICIHVIHCVILARACLLLFIVSLLMMSCLLVNLAHTLKALSLYNVTIVCIVTCTVLTTILQSTSTINIIQYYQFYIHSCPYEFNGLLLDNYNVVIL